MHVLCDGSIPDVVGRRLRLRNWNVSLRSFGVKPPSNWPSPQ
jgi:hypothetical protein